MNQYTGELTAAILKAAQAPNGMRTNQIPGYSVIQVGRICNSLRLAGKLFCARISHKVARYYTDEAAAKAAHQEPVSKRSGPKITIVRARASIGPGHIKGEATSGENVKITIAPPIPDRFAPPAGYLGELSALKPGQYATPAQTCAARAA